jgi:hypothetical protein
MKIRTGFVSNSSSSSFILIGNEISIDIIDIDMVKKSRFAFDTGRYGDGQVWVDSNEMTPDDFIKILTKINEDGNSLTVYEVYQFTRGGADTLDLVDFCSKNIFQYSFKIIAGELDNYLPDSFEDFMERGNLI